MKLKITILLGTSRQDNQSQKVALFLKSILESYSDLQLSYLDLTQPKFPVMEQRLDEMDEPPEGLAEWNETFQSSDGILIVAPEYKNGYSGALKNLFDYLPRAVYRYKPVAISTVSSGQAGGVNCLAQLRLICLALAGLPIPDSLPVAFVKQQFPDNGEGPDEKLKERAEKFLSEFHKYVKACTAL